MCDEEERPSKNQNLSLAFMSNRIQNRKIELFRRTWELNNVDKDFEENKWKPNNASFQLNFIELQCNT